MSSTLPVPEIKLCFSSNWFVNFDFGVCRAVYDQYFNWFQDFRSVFYVDYAGKIDDYDVEAFLTGLYQAFPLMWLQNSQWHDLAAASQNSKVGATGFLTESFDFECLIEAVRKAGRTFTGFDLMDVWF